MLGRLAEMEAHFKTSAQAKSQAVEVDPDAKARLAALGYVGSFVANVGDDASRAGLADPKDKVHLFNKISSARDIGHDENEIAAAMAMLDGGRQGRPEGHRRVVHAREHVGAPGPARRRRSSTSSARWR